MTYGKQAINARSPPHCPRILVDWRKPVKRFPMFDWRGGCKDLRYRNRPLPASTAPTPSKTEMCKHAKSLIFPWSGVMPPRVMSVRGLDGVVPHGDATAGQSVSDSLYTRRRWFGCAGRKQVLRLRGAEMAGNVKKKAKKKIGSRKAVARAEETVATSRSAKKTSTKKATTKKATTKKATTKKAATKKAATKKTEAKKAAARKSAPIPAKPRPLRPRKVTPRKKTRH